MVHSALDGQRFEYAFIMIYVSIEHAARAWPGLVRGVGVLFRSLRDDEGAWGGLYGGGR